MRFNFTEQIKEPVNELLVGNVYNVRGGRGARVGHMHVIVSLTETGVVTLTVDKVGEVVGAGCYARHYFEEKTPMAYAHGLEELQFDIKSL